MFTSGGGGILFAMGKREGTILRNLEEGLEGEGRMTDFNAALGYAQLREFGRVSEKRREIRSLLSQSLAAGRHRSFLQTGECEAGTWSFPVILESSVKDAIAYAKKKEVETRPCFEGSCLAKGLVPEGRCPAARSLGLRTLLFPLHQRIGNAGIQKLARVLATLP
jgi:dTDP-4-amino-4,6-dideoxygalactose transaminase